MINPLQKRYQYRFTFAIIIITAFSLTVRAQEIQHKNLQHKLIQVSIVPGLSTNGMHPGGFINHFSLNLSSGYSAGNKGIEVGILSNLNEQITRGFQFAGLLNITGANAYAGLTQEEIKAKINEGFEANLYGGQFSGLANIVLTNTFGLQVSGGFNITKNALFGVQIAGLSNTVKEYTFGIQLAGISNSSVHSIDGVQIASLLNFTTGQLQGIQVGSINVAGLIEGKNSLRTTSSTGLQLGLFNKSKTMNGFQIGLINWSGTMQGTQIGLINIYHGGHEMGTRDGTSIGLLNIGQTANLKVFANESFLTNYSLVTGTGKNFRLRQKNYNVYIFNEVIFGYNPDLLKNDDQVWSIGYGLTYTVFNRSSIPSQGEKKFGELGLEVHHLQNNKNKGLQLYSKIKSNIGIRVFPKLSWLYAMAGVSYIFFSDVTPPSMNVEESINTVDTGLGFQAGVLIH